ncbi:unnamed protein product [Diatraea saccharalis]|uniref:Uncharacterized protein n=1 Tax=Diatraea saccharalis TaxID=40085 RepID=A0A9N9WCA1_9NEOP|nr:unnamed protein product [Diatraea saccharalis]
MPIQTNELLFIDYNVINININNNIIIFIILFETIYHKKSFVTCAKRTRKVNQYKTSCALLSCYFNINIDVSIRKFPSIKNISFGNALLVKITQMFDRSKQCNLSHKMMIRLNNFLYVFNLRQGTILIAVHQIALSSFVLIILLVGISHVGEMLSMLHTDMEDDAESRGFYEVTYGQQLTFHEGDVVSTNNQRRFAKAQHLASGKFLYITYIRCYL